MSTFPNAGKPWTDSDDRFLIFYGRCVGHDYVTEHDLDRPAQEGLDRFAWSAANKPDLVTTLEFEADRPIGIERAKP